MTRVEIRKRKRGVDRVSLYIDYYPPVKDLNTGKLRRQEFLKLYIYEKPKGQAQKDYNRSILDLAEEIKANRINEIRKADIYNEFEKERLRLKEIEEQDFFTYFKTLIKTKKNSNRLAWKTTLTYLENCFPNGLCFGDITVKSMNSFKDFLLSSKSIRSERQTISQNTALSYFKNTKAALKQAFKDDLLQKDISSMIAPIKVEETYRDFLTQEELQKLVITPCQIEVLKRAALFSALTGLRFSDIAKLKGKEVHNDSIGYYLTFTQQKTGGVETHYINKSAYELLGNPINDDNLVFEDLKYSAYNNKFLKEWIRAAGITKKITFHNFRHTYATLQINGGTSVFTVSKLLGHKNVKTTQIYTKVVDERKREAVDRVNLVL